MTAPDVTTVLERVLVLAPAPADLRMALEVVHQAGLTPQVCANLDELCAALEREPAVMLLARGALAEPGVSRLERVLAQVAASPDLPVIVFSSQKAGAAAPTPEDRLQPRLGNPLLLESPISPRTFVSVLRFASRTRRQNPARELLAPGPGESSQSAAEEMDTFTHTISHDLRAPLRAIRGFAQALVEDCGAALDATGREYLQRMQQGSERMEQLIHDLLQYSRLARPPLTSAPVRLDDIVQHALQQLDSEVRSSRASIDISQPLHLVLAHEPTLQQVVTCLVSNALKFVPAGVQPRVRIWSAENASKVRLSIKDRGLGIAPAHHERIFGIFERLHSTEAYPGTGIGLAMVAKGMARMGGAVGLESAPGEGSCFWIELPRATDGPGEG